MNKCCVKCHPVVPLSYIGKPHGGIFDMPISKPIANWDQISVWWYPQCTWGKYRIVFVTLLVPNKGLEIEIKIILLYYYCKGHKGRWALFDKQLSLHPNQFPINLCIVMSISVTTHVLEFLVVCYLIEALQAWCSETVDVWSSAFWNEHLMDNEHLMLWTFCDFIIVILVLL